MTAKARTRYTLARGGSAGPSLVAAKTVHVGAPPKRSARIRAATARATFPGFHPQNVFLMDPEKPTVDANALLTERGGAMTDPRSMNHNCPFCRKTMAWELFQAHALACVTRWFKTMDVTKRKFAGGGPNA